MAIEYRDVLAFLAVARCESYSRAAEKLHLAQSGLSRRVQRLEQDLGVALLERHPRGVTATKAGEMLVSRAEKVDAELRRIESELRSFSAAPLMEAGVAMPQGVARFFTTPVIERFHARCPQVKLRIFERESVYNRESVLAGEADFALAYNPRPHADLTLVPLLYERIFVIAPGPAISAETFPPSYDLTALESLPLILPGRPHSYREVILQAAGREDFSPNIVMELNGLATSLEMVQRGLGFTISTYPPVQSGVEAGKLICIPIASPNCEVTLSLVHRGDRPMAPVLGELKAVIQEVARLIEPSPHWRKAETGTEAMPV